MSRRQISDQKYQDWLDRDRVPLADANLTETETDLPLFGKSAECESGYCFI